MDGELYEKHKEFIEWASQYDDGDLNIRSRKLHEKWLNELPCKVLILEEVFELEDKLNKVLEVIEIENNHD